MTGNLATHLYGAKFFTTLEVKNGFWHVTLDEQLLFCTTFYTPFRNYHWNRMPCGICSMPEIFQHRIHKLTEGLPGVEVIADNTQYQGIHTMMNKKIVVILQMNVVGHHAMIHNYNQTAPTSHSIQE